MNFNKKAYFFLIDSILALSVLVIGAFLVFTFYIEKPSATTPEMLSEDLMTFFANNKISDINDIEIGLNGAYWSSQDVVDCNGEPITPDAQSTLLQQIAILYKTKQDTGTNCYTDVIARGFVERLTRNALPLQYKFEFWMNNELIYPATEELVSKGAAKVLIPSKKIVYGIFNQETGDMFGPYSTEVLVWR